MRHRTRAASGLLGVATTATVPDESMAENCPLFAREQGADSMFGFDWVFGDVPGHPVESAHESGKVRIHGQSWNIKGIAEDDVGRLAADSAQRHQFFESAWDLAVIPGDDVGSKCQQAVGLGTEEPGRSDDFLDRRTIGGGEGVRIGKGGEKRWGDRIDSPIGGLRRQYGDDEELKRVVEIELTTGVGIGLGQNTIDFAGPPDQRCFGSRRSHVVVRHTVNTTCAKQSAPKATLGVEK